MMRLRWALGIVLLFLLASTTTAHAECGWVLVAPGLREGQARARVHEHLVEYVRGIHLAGDLRRCEGHERDGDEGGVGADRRQDHPYVPPRHRGPARAEGEVVGRAPRPPDGASGR